MAGFSDFGNGSGYLYVTAPDGTTILSAPPNTNWFSVWMLQQALTAAPSSGEVLATGTVTVNVGGGTITTCTVNGVDVMGATAATGATTALLAADLADKINTKLSSPDYTALVIGASANVVQIKAKKGTGSTPNGYVISVGVTAPTTVTVANMGGGVSGAGIYSPVFGQRFFINSDPSAVQDDLTGSTEITANIAMRGFQSELYAQNVTISTGIVTPFRAGSVMVEHIDTEGMAGTDTLDTIDDTGFQAGDVLIFCGVNSSRVTTFSNGTGNIFLANATNFSTGDYTQKIMLQYQTIDGATGWYELTRTAILPTYTNLRTFGNIPYPHPGVNTISMTTSGTTNLVVGVDKYYQVISGSPVLVGGIVIQPSGGSPIDGDSFILDYRATPTTGGVQTVTLGNITLTDTQATSGNVIVTCTYKSLGTTWEYTLVPKTNGIDVESVAHAASTYQVKLPASGGDTFVLQKTIAGDLSFVPNGGNGLLTAHVTVPTASVLNSYSVPYQIIPALGANLAIEVISATAQLRSYATTPYATNTTLILVTDTATNVNYQASCTNILARTGASLKRFTTYLGAADNNAQLIPNKALMVSTLTGNPTAGDSDIDVFVSYRVITLVPLT